jgi:inosine/xanthosine triphosphate pyrophosphatase family protein
VPTRGPTVFGMCMSCLVVKVLTLAGWDSCFEYEGKTYAEMEAAEKNKISHRGKALEKLKEWLAQEV